MFKKALTALAFLAFGLVPAIAGNVSIPSGPQDPSNMGNLINSLIISGNNNWSPQGPSFVTAGSISANATVAVTFTSLGPNGLSPTTIVSWLKLRGYINNTTTPTFFFIPLWGCPTCL